MTFSLITLAVIAFVGWWAVSGTGGGGGYDDADDASSFGGGGRAVTHDHGSIDRFGNHDE